MALLSDKVYLGTDLLDLLLQPHRLPGTAVERSLVDQHIVSQEGVVDHFLDSLFPSSEENLKPCSPLWVPSPCDSGISEDAMDSPHPSYPEATHYTKEAAYSPSPVPGSPLFPAMFLPQVVKMEPDFSIDLADWEAGLFSEGLSSSSSATTISPSPIQKSLTVKDLLLSNMAEPSKPSTQQSRQLILNDDEKKLLVKEGVSLPSQLPLNKYEEKILKKIRRKIRNKQSAQESRKKKKEYVDGLEGRMAACSAHNQELQRKVFQLEKSNTSVSVLQMQTQKAEMHSGI
ncbi:hypothetical protein DNTS_015133 [Danionella cerebrum]|uniref:BZIP domain-containing protein n=1 Tax=Danionella cerebrum TaxID=2873325 RepID=A0A553QNK3_9TELE|nr:hypothetical protein DNTS_015133 [Danionella translucida]TRY91561.1 hypothetical protein DNTS_015133 [Danionella translucida]